MSTDEFSPAQGWLFEHVVEPVVFNIGLGGYVEDAFDAAG